MIINYGLMIIDYYNVTDYKLQNFLIILYIIMIIWLMIIIIIIIFYNQV